MRLGRPERVQFEEPEARDFGSWSYGSKTEYRFKEGVRTYESARMRAPVLKPLCSAFRAGLLYFWVLEPQRWRNRHCVCVPRPALHLANGRLHRDDGPAVEWASGVSYWFWEGLQVPRRVAATS